MHTPGALTPPRLDGHTVSRSINAENPSGERGNGGRTASHLGLGRKGRPCLTLATGETTTLADITGTGQITHLWVR